MSTQVCFICNSASENCQANLAEIKSRYSSYSLRIFIKKFLRNFVPSRNATDSTNCICAECLKQVNEYDALCVKAKMIEDYLHTLLVNSDKSWHAAQNTTIDNDDVKFIEIHETKPVVQIEKAPIENFASTSLDPKEKTPHKCLNCGEKFEYKIDFLHHERTHKKDQRTDGLKCALCSVVSENEAARGLPSLQCTQCKKTFTQRKHFAAHMLRHKNRQNYQCEMCGKLFSCQPTLQSHMKSHSEVRTRVCHICSKGFKLTHNLKKHLDVAHKGEK